MADGREPEGGKWRRNADLSFRVLHPSHGGMIPGAACDESGLKGGAEGEEQEREK